LDRTGLQLAFSIDTAEPRIVTIDKDVDVSSRKWSFNVLGNQTTASEKVELTAGHHVLRIYAVETGVVLDQIIISPAAALSSNASN